MLSEGRQRRSTANCLTPFNEMSRKGQFIKTEADQWLLCAEAVSGD